MENGNGLLLKMLFGLAVLALVQLGCSSKQHLQHTDFPYKRIPIILADGFQWPDKDLAERFQQYWSIRKAGDSDELKKLEAPHVLQIISPVVYERNFGKKQMDWVSIRIERSRHITEQLVEVDFLMQVRDQDVSTRDVFYRDTWLMFSNKWMHVIKDPFLTGDGLGR